jgi:hypothetical protein
MANYNVPYVLATPVPGPFVCLQATMMDALALHFMCEIVGELKREANAVARRIKTGNALALRVQLIQIKNTCSVLHSDYTRLSLLDVLY